MSDATTETPDVNAPETDQSGSPDFEFQKRYGEVVGKVNETLDKVDWSQLGKFGKAAGILLAVIIAQILIKGVLDTINLLPIVPGLLELLGLVVVGNWAWSNLTTSEKRSELMSRVDHLKKEYLG
ncbi:MAG: CAAD domain-containing protein [Cyanobacteriota bacterium]|nr:CAAD domain-containing protein [Cyanobacteriota bacterium]